MMTPRNWFLLGVAWVFLASATMIGHTLRHAQADEGHAGDDGSHMTGKLGTVHFPISCDPAVQEEFNRGVAFLHHFATQRAEETFTALLEMDPHRAMEYWGAAVTWGAIRWPVPPHQANHRRPLPHGQAAGNPRRNTL